MSLIGTSHLLSECRVVQLVTLSLSSGGSLAAHIHLSLRRAAHLRCRCHLFHPYYRTTFSYVSRKVMQKPPYCVFLPPECGATCRSRDPHQFCGRAEPTADVYRRTQGGCSRREAQRKAARQVSLKGRCCILLGLTRRQPRVLPTTRRSRREPASGRRPPRRQAWRRASWSCPSSGSSAARPARATA